MIVSLKTPSGPAFLFPGNDIAYAEDISLLGKHPVFQNLLGRGSPIFQSRVKGKSGPAEQEIHDQMMIYTLSCASNDLLKNKKITPSVVSGYSFGLYAALYGAEVFNYETGLHILIDAVQLVKDHFESSRRVFGMGAVLGLTEEDLKTDVFPAIQGAIEIACYNGERSHILVGDKEAVKESLSGAEKAGAFKTRLLNTRYGYHTTFLRKASEIFSDRLIPYYFQPSICDVISSLNGETVPQDRLKPTVAMNISSHIHWPLAVSAMGESYGIDRAYEMAPGTTIWSMTRYINKELKVLPFSLEAPE
jgi:malonyl CoA-acyl carrier protein transacylase